MNRSELVPASRGGPVALWTAEQVDLIRQQICDGASDDELAFFAQVCRHRQLDPFAGEIVGIMRWNSREQRNVMKIQVTVEGLRTIAMRTGLYAGQDEILWCGPDGAWLDIWPDREHPPFAAKTAVYRIDIDRPFPGKAHFHEFAQFDSKGRLTPMWQKMPANQLGKCAERQALIRAFKKELRAAGIKLDDELSVPSRVSMEAREIGLDDDGRHALVAEVTDGRTDSTRDLQPDEVIEVRSEIARRRPVKHTAAGPDGTETYWVDPDTGEFVDPPDPSEDGAPPEPPEHDDVEEVHGTVVEHGPGPGPERTPAAPAPAGATGYVDPTGRVHVPPNRAPGERPDVTDLKARIRLLPADQRPNFEKWLKACGIPDSIDDVSEAKVAAINAELDRRGVPPVRPAPPETS